MFIAYVAVTILAILANAAVAVFDTARASSALANSAEVGVPQSYLPALAALKAAGAAGLLLGLLGAPVIGVAAAIGLTIFFVGAVVIHVRGPRSSTTSRSRASTSRWLLRPCRLRSCSDHSRPRIRLLSFVVDGLRPVPEGSYR